jgi:hypothetical protein
MARERGPLPSPHTPTQPFIGFDEAVASGSDFSVTLKETRRLCQEGVWGRYIQEERGPGRLT